MFRGIVILLLLTCAHVRVKCKGLPSRIVGGKDAEDGAYPYQASIRVNGMHKCGGSVVGSQWILTAAHCLKHDPSSIAIVLGSNSLLTGGVAYRTDKLIVHPGYDRALHKDDIGLIKVNGHISYRRTIAPIGLPSEDVNESDCTAVFTGWGNVETAGSNNNQLQVADLRILELEKCGKSFSKIRRTNLCTLTIGGQGICYGDSGSPLVANGVQIAIGSWGSPCATGYPDVHTRVFSYVDWIKSHID